ncbi:MAG TPA: sirohydrochlorin chelatase [Mycobacteriales bacterium]|nr:sirohydrochlorin chelatase [Mycobacteriales bacterium]
MTGPGPLLLAVAHGSSDPAAVGAHRALLGRIRAAAPGVEVRLGYLGHTDPPVLDVLRECAATGRNAVVVPLLLVAASHARGDIPAAIRAARRDGVRFDCARVLGPHPLLLRAIHGRLAAAGVPASAALVLAAAGSADPDANAEVAGTARLLWEWRGGMAPVEPAFASATGPSVAEAVARLRRLGHGAIAMASYFLAPGRLLSRAAAGANGLVATEPLADTDEVAALVLERYAEALVGPAALSGDTGMYRAPWPGSRSDPPA